MSEPSSHWTWTVERTIRSCCVEGHGLILEIIDQLQRHHWCQKDVFGVHLALQEAIENAIKHGNRADPEKNVHVSCKVSAERCWVEIQDEGPGFNPLNVPDCTLDENLDKPSGRGLKLMRNFMSLIEYNECGNRVVMEKVIEAGE